MNKKLVSILLPDFHGNGCVRTMLVLAKGLIERGLDVDIVTLKAEGDGLIWMPPGARIVELNCRMGGLNYIIYLRALVRYLRKQRPAAVMFMDEINLVSIAKFLAGVRSQVIATCHVNYLREYILDAPEEVKNSKKVYLLKRFLWFYGWADAIVSVSCGVADDLEKIAGRPLKQMRVIYNPVITPDFFCKANEPIDHPWFVPGQPPVILGVGRFNFQKDFPTLIQAFAIVRQQIPARLMILGEGNKEERDSLEALVQELGLTADVALPGFVKNPYAYMSKAGLFVLTSIYEGFSLVLVEAIACGTPVISTDCPSGPAEILENGKYGKLAAVGDVQGIADAIISSLTTPTDTEAAQLRAKQFSLEASVEKYLELI